jgi:peptide/nickel transport system substrate-binding protein
MVAAALLTGCGDHKPQSNTTIRIRWAHDPETLDPLSLHNQAALDAYNLLNISLLQADVATGKLAPALADSLPVTRVLNDSLTGIDYRIRPAATWDDGRPIGANDVAFTLKLMFCPGLPNESAQSQFRFIRAVQAARDPRHFTFVCRGQSVEHAQITGDFFILPEAALDPEGYFRRFTLGDFQQHRPGIAVDSGIRAVARRYQAATAPHVASPLPGCGAYQLVQWEKDRYLTFRRKANWWADQVRPAPLVLQARPARLHYAIIPDAATATLALRRGDLDVYPQVPAREFERLRNSPTARKDLRFYTTSSYDVVTVGFNTRRPALADALTRQALSRCFDAPGLLRATQIGQGQLTVGLISPADHLNYNDSLSLVPFAPQQATALLRQAGWRQHPQGAAPGWYRADARGRPQRLQLTLRYRASDDLFTTIALQFRAAALGIGVPVELLPTESGAFSMALKAGDFDLFLRTLRGNPFMFNFTSVLHTAGIGAGNAYGFGTLASDQLIEAIIAASSPRQRAQRVRQLQSLMQQQVPLTPLFFLSNRIVARRDLAGLYPNSLKPGYSAATLERPSAPAPAP